VQKLQVIVELLMGDIPNRQVFSNPEYKQALLPYYQIVTSVKQGDMITFKNLLVKHQALFAADKNLTLI
jgi:26S proteasome regulatory subunit N3